MSALLGMNHALLEIEQLGRGDRDALNACRGAMAIGPEIAGEDVTQKITFHNPVVLGARRQTVLALEFRVGLSVIATRKDGIRLTNITPPVARLSADMLGQKVAPLAVHLEVRHGVARGPNGDIQLITAAMGEPAR